MVKIPIIALCSVVLYSVITFIHVNAAPPNSNYIEITIDPIQDNASESGCTLREALNIANAGGTSDVDDCTLTAVGALTTTYVINMPTFTYTLDNGDLDITANTVHLVGNETIIQAASVAPLTSTQVVDRVLYVGSAASVEMSNTTIRHGACIQTTAPCTYHSNANDFTSGSGILNNGNLSLFNVTITDNYASNVAGGLFNNTSTAQLSIQNSTFSNNESGTTGGALYNLGSAHISLIENTTFTGNKAGSSAGAINNDNSTITTIVNSTFTSNSAANRGGALRNKSSSTIGLIANSTFDSNTADMEFGGVFNDGGTITILTHNIISNNSNGDCGNKSGTISSATFNLIETDSFSFACDDNEISTDPNLSALASNGGATQTMAVNTPSDVINGGDTTCPTATHGVDQRGVARSGNCDLGAYESGIAAPTVSFTADKTTIFEQGSSTVATISVTPNNHTAGDDILAIFQFAGTATKGSDYSVSSNLLTFSPGSGTQQLIITGLVDGSIEATETIEVKMLLIGAASDVSATNPITINLIEPALFEISDATIVEGSGGGNMLLGLTVTRSGNTTSAVSVDYFTSDNTATASADYTSIPATTLDFASSETTKQIFVNVIADDVVEADETLFVNLTNPTSGAVVDAQGVGTITNDDTLGITVSPVGGLVTTEAGGAATFGVILTSAPNGNVMIDVTSSDITEGLPNSSQLIFNGSNWNTIQMVTVTGQDDTTADGTIAYTIILTINTGTTTDTSGYAALDPADVNVDNTDNDSHGITVLPNTISTSETGTNVSFSVSLTSSPSADVTLSITGLNTAEGSLTTHSLTFTPANFASAQTVTVTGVDDALADGNITYTLTLTSSSSDPGYNGLSETVTVTNLDNDSHGITVLPNTISTSETGTSASFSVSLTSSPSADVTLTITGLNTAEGSLTTHSLTFTPANFASAQTVTVTGVDDAFADGNITYTLTLTSSSSDPGYNGLSETVTVTNLDNDSHGITVLPNTISTSETGTSASFSVSLTSSPSADVTLTITGLNTAEGSLTTSSLTFTPANFASAQTVTVTGVDDALADGNITYTLTLTSSSSDPGYNGLSETVTVTNLDNEIDGTCTVPSSTGAPPIRPTLTFDRPATDGQYRFILWNATVKMVMFDTTQLLSNLCINETSCTITPDAKLLPFGVFDGDHELYSQLQPTGDWTVVTRFNVDETPPVAPANLGVNRNQGRPSITFDHDLNALYYQVYVGKAGTLEQVHLKWYEKQQDVCCGTSCELLLDLFVPSGSYVIYVRAWGPGGFSTGGLQGWSGPVDVDLNFATPQVVTNFQTPTLANNKATLKWEGVAGGTYYQIWLGTLNPLNTVYTKWVSAVKLGCPDQGTCTLTPDELLTPGTEYNWYVQSYGPGGLSTGGVVAGWAEGPAFTP